MRTTQRRRPEREESVSFAVSLSVSLLFLEGLFSASIYSDLGILLVIILLA